MYGQGLPIKNSMITIAFVYMSNKTNRRTQPNDNDEYNALKQPKSIILEIEILIWLVCHARHFSFAILVVFFCFLFSWSACLFSSTFLIIFVIHLSFEYTQIKLKFEKHWAKFAD